MHFRRISTEFVSKLRSVLSLGMKYTTRVSQLHLMKVNILGRIQEDICM